MNLQKCFSLRIDLSSREILFRRNVQPRDRLIFNPVALFMGLPIFGDYSYIKEFSCIVGHIPGRCIGRRMHRCRYPRNTRMKSSREKYRLIVAFVASRRMAGEFRASRSGELGWNDGIQRGTRCPIFFFFCHYVLISGHSSWRFRLKRGFNVKFFKRNDGPSFFFYRRIIFKRRYKIKLVNESASWRFQFVQCPKELIPDDIRELISSCIVGLNFRFAFYILRN